jgi:hypothetical protein
LNHVRTHANVATFAYCYVTGQMRAGVDVAVRAYCRIMADGRGDIKDTITVNESACIYYDSWEYCYSFAEMSKSRNVRQRRNRAREAQVKLFRSLDKAATDLRRADGANNRNLCAIRAVEPGPVAEDRQTIKFLTVYSRVVVYKSNRIYLIIQPRLMAHNVCDLSTVPPCANNYDSLQPA